MKICLACHAHYPSAAAPCPACGARPQVRDGIEFFAPALAEGGSGFKDSYFAELAAKEASNFWFRARNRLIIHCLGTLQPDLESFLEIGCGTGYVLAGVAQAFPRARLHGSELHWEGLGFARTRVPSAKLMQMDAREIPFDGEFSAVGAFDVLEHIEDDVEVLKQMHAALKPGGALLVTVPQHAWLWSPLDVSACHVRRYARSDLHSKLAGAGFSVVRSTSFVTGLLPFMLLSRIAARMRSSKHVHGLPEIDIHPWLDRIFSLEMALEFLLIRLGISLPVGGSRIVVARKLPAPGAPTQG